MKVYTCPDCGKYLVVEEPEPPGILHECDDCSRPLEESGYER